MAANPLIVQGTLNRIRGSVVVPSYPGLNVTAPYLGKPGISLALEGNATTQIGTMTGSVTSPEPYMMVAVRIALLRTQSLSGAWKAQMESVSTIGAITVNPDTSAFPSYTFTSCAIESVGEQRYDGTDPGFLITLSGVYQINASLYNLV